MWSVEQWIRTISDENCRYGHVPFSDRIRLWALIEGQQAKEKSEQLEAPFFRGRCVLIRAVVACCSFIRYIITPLIDITVVTIKEGHTELQIASHSSC